MQFVFQNKFNLNWLKSFKISNEKKRIKNNKFILILKKIGNCV